MKVEIEMGRELASADDVGDCEKIDHAHKKQLSCDSNDNVDHDNVNADHGDEVGNEDVVARVREVCSQLRRAKLGHQQLKS